MFFVNYHEKTSFDSEAELQLPSTVQYTSSPTAYLPTKFGIPLSSHKEFAALGSIVVTKALGIILSGRGESL